MPNPAQDKFEISYQPILDVARGVAAGYQAQLRWDPAPDVAARHPSGSIGEADGQAAAVTLTAALSASSTRPADTFFAVPLGVRVAASEPVRAALRDHGKLSGIVIDIVGPIGAVDPGFEAAMAEYREAGAVIAVGGYGAAQPELANIVRLSPGVLRLGRDWVRGIDTSAAKHSTVQLIARLADHVAAALLAEGVTTAEELGALAELDVALAQGPFIGAADPVWSKIAPGAQTALPLTRVEADGVLRGLLQQAYTATDAAAAATVLPETTGFDVVVVIDEQQRPTTLLEHSDEHEWDASDALAVTVDTPVAEAVHRAMTRPRAARLSPLVCTDDAGHFLGILRLERLMSHLAGDG